MPNEWSHIDLFNFFEAYRLGTIVGTYLSRNPGLPTNKGFGFVNYSTPEEAELAVTVINGAEAAPRKRLKVSIKRENYHFHGQTNPAPAEGTGTPGQGY